MVNLDQVKPEDFWYVVGFIAADGNLSSNQRHINITSKDIGHLEEIRRALHLGNKITRKARGRETERKYGAFQFGDVRFYKKLMALGLTPNKSLTLGALKVPGSYFNDFLRGVIDGDGNIHTWMHPQNGGEQWELRISSAAPNFASWLYEEISTRFGVKGILITQKDERRVNKMQVIKFGKMAAREILKHCYYDGALSLNRKRELAMQCCSSYRGWNKSFTLSNSS